MEERQGLPISPALREALISFVAPEERHVYSLDPPELKAPEERHECLANPHPQSPGLTKSDLFGRVE